jgi:RNA polymerase sigma-70 factor (ECF subfamily)
VAFCVLGEAALAEDAAQEACIALYRGITSLRDPGAFNAWLYRIVVRESARARRRRARAEAVAEAAASSEPSGVDLDIQRALASLSPALREVTVLYYFEDLASREIAAILGVPDGTVRVRLMMARRKLRATLTGYRELCALDDTGISDYAI